MKKKSKILKLQKKEHFNFDGAERRLIEVDRKKEKKYFRYRNSIVVTKSPFDAFTSFETLLLSLIRLQ